MFVSLPTQVSLAYASGNTVVEGSYFDVNDIGPGDSHEGPPERYVCTRERTYLIPGRMAVNSEQGVNIELLLQRVPR